MREFVSTQLLRECGITKRDLERAIRAGSLTRVRRGIYSSCAADDPQVLAGRVGGQLTGVSAIAALGGWLPRPPQVLHVAVPRTHSRLRLLQAGMPVVVHWVDRPATLANIASLDQVLIRVALDEELETVVSCFDWALATGRIDLIDLELVLRALPKPGSHPAVMDRPQFA